MQIPVGVKWAHLHGSINNTSVLSFTGTIAGDFRNSFSWFWRENT
jgi:hypothetical protein